MNPQGVLAEAHGGLKIVVPNKESRPVRLTDIFRVLKGGFKIKLAMLTPFPGRYEEAACISHCQITEKDPLRFFVVSKKFGWKFGNKILGSRTIINPEILEVHGDVTKEKEGCMSIPMGQMIRVPRREIVKVRYWTFRGPRIRTFYMFMANMVQHELDHMNNFSMLDKNAQKDRYKRMKHEMIKEVRRKK